MHLQDSQKTLSLSRAARTLAGSTFVLAGLAVYAGSAKAQAQPTQPSTGTTAIATYESAGLYWQSPGGTAGCEVQFRKAGETAWQQGLPMWYDARDQQCRGSIVGLTENTEYQVEFSLPGQAPSRGLVVKTWPNQRPVARTVTVNSGSQTYNITEGGSASGYVVYEGNGATLDAQNAATYNITINASYVIVRGLNLRGAVQDAIRISPNVTDVIIEDNDIAGWGRTRDGKYATNMDSAVRAYCTTPTLQRVTIQRNRIHSPRYPANSWLSGHPAGAQAIAFSHCGGNHVFRHNEIFSANGNYFNDIIGGEDNFTKAGFPNSDTDIYGNKLSHAWDDGIEAEGANENVRIWGNYIDRTAIGIATTATSVGPIYIFRNVWNRAQMYEGRVDTDDRQPFFKSGGTSTLGYGRRYVFHNTMLQATQPDALYGLGGGYGMGGTGSTQLIENTFSKNNIYHLWKSTKGAFYQVGSGNEIAGDMYNGTAGTTIVNGINATPQYASGHGWQSEADGNYQLAPGTAGSGSAVRIPNFNDAYEAADVGAHQAGTASMRFGIAGSPGNSLGGAVTEPPPPPPPPPAPTPTTYSLGVTSVGSGTGTVTSSPAGIDCGSSCTTTFASGTSVTLTASPATGSTFAGWSGACTGTGACTVPMNAAQSVTATFNAAATPTPTPAPSGVVANTTSLVNFATTRTQAVTFTNNTASRVTFMQASMSSARFGQTNNCGEVAPGGNCVVTITYYPTNSGPDTGTFTLTSDAPNSPHVVSLSAASATPTPPATGSVTQSASSLSFSSSGRQSVTFTNNTGVAVTFIQASVTSTRYSQANNCGAVAPGASCTVSFTYTASGSGSKNATFTMTSTAPNSPHRVTLSAK